LAFAVWVKSTVALDGHEKGEKWPDFAVSGDVIMTYGMLRLLDAMSSEIAGSRQFRAITSRIREWMMEPG